MTRKALGALFNKKKMRTKKFLRMCSMRKITCSMTRIMVAWRMYRMKYGAISMTRLESIVAGSY